MNSFSLHSGSPYISRLPLHETVGRISGTYSTRKYTAGPFPGLFRIYSREGVPGLQRVGISHMHLQRCLFLVLITALLSGCATLNSARRPEPDIREELLSETPLGSSYESVYQHIRRTYPDETPYVDEKTRSIRADVGGHWTWGILVGCVVSATWEFDENDRLRDIKVEKWYDGP